MVKITKGTKYNDTLFGTSSDDIMFGLDGDDTLNGGSGIDILWGGNGNDRLFGGFDNDILWGGSGNDFIRGEDGNDALFGGDGNDDIDGGLGDDVLIGGDGDDILHGRGGTDILLGGAGDDRLTGVALTNDILDGGTGTDTAALKVGTSPTDGSYANLSLGYATSGPLHVNYVTLINIENLEGDTGPDTLIGDDGANVLVGSGGNDLLTGNGGADTFLYAPDLNFGGDLGGGDIITDFKQSGDADKINLSRIYAGVLSFTEDATTTVAANTVNWYESGGDTIVEADVNGDDAADFQITLLGTGLSLAAADFVL